MKSVKNRAKVPLNIAKWNTRYLLPFPIDSGVHQGSILDPFLFNLVVHWVSENALQGQNIGVTLDDMVIAELVFADDICLTEDNPEDAQKLLNCFTNSTAKCSLQKDTLTTKFCSRFPSDYIECLGEPLEQVNSFCYLGSNVQLDGDVLHED